MAVRTKRAYEPPATEDGYRVLVDRLWPRGRTKEQLRLDAWLRELAPSDGLRKWFGHDTSRWSEFQARYQEELAGARRQELLRDLAERAVGGTVTLVYGARDDEHNNAVVLRDAIEAMSKGDAAAAP